MTVKPGLVVILLEADDPSLMERLIREMQVWAARTPASEALAATLIRDDPASADRFTVFTFDAEGDVEDQVVQVIYDVDLHYGSSGGHPPLQRLDVYGTVLTDPVKLALEKFGLSSTEATADGFKAVRANDSVESTVEFGCDYCEDNQNRWYGHVKQIGSNEERGMILIRCPKCGALYENTPFGEDQTRRLGEDEARRLFPDAAIRP